MVRWWLEFGQIVSGFIAVCMLVVGLGLSLGLPLASCRTMSESQQLSESRDIFPIIENDGSSEL